MDRHLFELEHEEFRAGFRRFLEKELVPYADEWEHAGIVPRDIFAKAGRHGFLGFSAPYEYGGAGIEDFRYNVVIAEEVQRAGVNAPAQGLILQNDVCLPYFLRLASDAQKQRWLPGITSGELITAIAMTEPSAGSDLAAIKTTARLEGDHYVVDGSKTFVTNGINSDLVIVAVRTDMVDRYGGISLLIVERGMPGFERGRKLAKIGLHAQDTAELFFNDCRVPIENLLGKPGCGFRYLMQNLAQERLSIAASGVAAARACLESTLAYARERRAFGQPIGSFQHSRFVLAEMKTAVAVATAFFDECVLALNRGCLTPEEAAMAKYWCTDLQNSVADRCLQLHGGYGYMLEYRVARAFIDARVTSIYGGTNEIMKEIIGRSLGL